MMPFDKYPDGGKKLLGILHQGGGTRMNRAPMLMQKTGQTTCVYCGLDFVKSLTNWLNIQLDHVVPKNDKLCKDLGVPYEWTWDYTNRVLACAACNVYDNQYSPGPELTVEFTRNVSACATCNETPESKCPKCLQAFYTLRDRIFRSRKERICKLREAEEKFFKQRPWEKGTRPYDV